MTIAFTTDTAMNFIYDGQTDEWPTGLAWKITAALFRKFRPRDTISKVELKMKLQQLRLKKKQDPSDLFRTLTALRNQYGRSAIDDDDILAHVFVAAGSEYHSIYTALKLSDKLTVSQLEDEMHNHWRALYGIEGTATQCGTEPGKELAFFANLRGKATATQPRDAGIAIKQGTSRRIVPGLPIKVHQRMQLVNTVAGKAMKPRTVLKTPRMLIVGQRGINRNNRRR
jgi:hypothetical protein